LLSPFTRGSAFVNHDDDAGSIGWGAKPISPCNSTRTRPRARSENPPEGVA
jgi:hypothetical protein